MALKFEDLPVAAQAAVRARVAGGLQRVNARERRRRGGRKANRAGDGFEAEIVVAAGRPGSVVAVELLPKSGARFHGKGQAHMQKMPCDLVGCVKRGERREYAKDGEDVAEVSIAIFMDAKVCGPEMGSLRVGDPKIVKLHQAEFLHRMHMAGAIAGVLVKCERKGDVRWLSGKYLWNPRMSKMPAIRWDDPRWLVLGRQVDFGKLVTAYWG